MAGAAVADAGEGWSCNGPFAFDKGIRLLAANQADDVAIESAMQKQGLLTCALAGEGLRPDTARADLNRDGPITLEGYSRRTDM